MMASKACLFGDDTALSDILATDDPREQKSIGRQVRHFDQELGQQQCENMVFHGNLAKFSPNEDMRRFESLRSLPLLPVHGVALTC